MKPRVQPLRGLPDYSPRWRLRLFLVILFVEDVGIVPRRLNHLRRRLFADAFQKGRQADALDELPDALADVPCSSQNSQMRSSRSCSGSKSPSSIFMKG